MSRPKMKRRIGFLASSAVLLVGFLGCSVDTPTAPDQVPAPPPTRSSKYLDWRALAAFTPSAWNTMRGRSRQQTMAGRQLVPWAATSGPRDSPSAAVQVSPSALRK